MGFWKDMATLVALLDWGSDDAGPPGHASLLDELEHVDLALHVVLARPVLQLQQVVVRGRRLQARGNEAMSIWVGYMPIVIVILSLLLQTKLHSRGFLM